MIEGSQFKTEIGGMLVNKVPAIADGFVLVSLSFSGLLGQYKVALMTC